VPANNPLYGGKMTVSRQREVKNVTSDAMVKLHKVWKSKLYSAITKNFILKRH
jgi:hypothetical protein